MHSENEMNYEKSCKTEKSTKISFWKSVENNQKISEFIPPIWCSTADYQKSATLLSNANNILVLLS